MLTYGLIALSVGSIASAVSSGTQSWLCIEFALTMSSHASSCVSAFGSQLRNPVTHRHAHHVRQHSRRSQARPVSAAATIATGPHTAAELPPSLRNTTAVLHTAEGAAAYVLGISHVSKESCQHIEELIRLVQPGTLGCAWLSHGQNACPTLALLKPAF